MAISSLARVGWLTPWIVMACTGAGTQPHREAASPTSQVPAQGDAVPQSPLASAQGLDDKGCVQSPKDHAVSLILQKHAKAIAERLGHDPTASELSYLTVGELPDVDGDGAKETVVTEGYSWGTHAMLQVLYFSNQGCLKFAGDILDGELVPASTRHQGVADLEATWSNGCAGLDHRWRQYRWMGQAYEVDDETTCSLCEVAEGRSAPSNANQHKHCQQELERLGKER